MSAPTDDLPAEIDAVLVPRVNLRTAAKYLGGSVRWLQRQIREGRIAAIDIGTGRKAHYAIAVTELREFASRAALRAKARQEEYRAAKAARSHAPDAPDAPDPSRTAPDTVRRRAPA